MEKRRPLHPLPLSCFLAPENFTDQRISPLKSASKRPRSPSAFLSPAKRRILREEGFLPSPSLSEPRTVCRERFLSQGGMDIRLRGHTEAGTLATLWDGSRCAGDDEAFVNTAARNTCFGVSTKEPVIPGNGLAMPRRSPRLSSRRADGPTTSSHVMPPLLVPRELPPRHNPQSCHYPGFDVYYDSHIELPSTSSRSSPDMDWEMDREIVKENLPLRKKARKATSLPTGGVADDTSSETTKDKTKAASYPATPYHNTPIHTPATPHIRRTPLAGAKTKYEITPGRTPDSNSSKYARKRALEQEVDEVCSDEED
ncbi:uncharacterized protein FOMMEDRAFT_169665 [Fomitiporia mediterranea MF3/22]|uniref:uncharacterized protein n=1 Tax=Fomitiporia mediterranea (strain MF3/22) TaxID=694068 RepID=UPI0004409479|nr:uncharacterized protein FOMMEDRAFT_169665 [Fomitiporia mediterranea MF3/22]EJD01574.1 hypothetical protein FOMMEDRAFT_169665 [Fomitiporia mediterranea MF3/22]